MAPLGGFATGAIGLVFALAAHARGWPVARGGSQSISDALAAYLRGPRRHRPHRLRGQAPRRPAARPRVRLRHLAHRPGPHRRLRQLLRRLPLRPRRLQDRLRAGRPRAVDRAGGPRRRHRADRREQRGDRRRAARGVPGGPGPRQAVPDHRAAQRRRPHPRPGGQARLLGVRPRPERLDRRPHRRHRTPTGALRPGVPRPRPRPRHRRPARTGRPQRQLRRRRHRLRRGLRPPAPAAPQSSPCSRTTPRTRPSSSARRRPRPARVCTACRGTTRPRPCGGGCGRPDHEGSRVARAARGPEEAGCSGRARPDHEGSRVARAARDPTTREAGWRGADPTTQEPPTTGRAHDHHHARPGRHHPRERRRDRQRGQLLPAGRGRGRRRDPPARRPRDPRGVPQAPRLHLGKGLPTGQAVATTAGDLDARWVIHTVGPVFSATEDRSDLLASCYRESLRVADELGARTVAFPAISTGVYRWPMDDAARIAVETVRAARTGGRGGPVRPLRRAGVRGVRRTAA